MDEDEEEEEEEGEEGDEGDEEEEDEEMVRFIPTSYRHFHQSPSFATQTY